MQLDLATNQIFSTLSIRAKTAVNYRSVYKNHLKPHIGFKDINEITREEIQQIIKPLPPQTGVLALSVLRTIYREAIEAGYTIHSPAATIRRPRIQVRDRKFLSVDELLVREFPKFKKQIIFLAMHGLRWGEALALTNQDIHDGRVYVNKSIHGLTKTRAGIRSVPLISEFALFPKTPKGIRRELLAHGVHIHSLRHSYAYLLKTSGVHVTTAQYLMGHANPSVTLGIYTRFRDEEIDRAGTAILDALAKSQKPGSLSGDRASALTS